MRGVDPSRNHGLVADVISYLHRRHSRVIVKEKC